MKKGIKTIKRKTIYFTYKLYLVQALILALFILLIISLIKKMTNFDFKFTEYILKDSIILDYPSFLTNIHNNIINTDNKNYLLKFGDIGIFPLIVHISDRLVNIVHHITLGSKKILMKTNGNFKVILSLRIAVHPLRSKI